MSRFNGFCLLILLTLGFPFCAVAQGPSCATVLTRSEQYRWLEKDSAERQAWIHQENAKTNKNLKESSNLKAVGDYAWRNIDKPKVLKSDELESGKMLELVVGGLGKPTELRLKGKNKSKVLFSNYDLVKNNSVSLLDYSLSPDESLVVGIFSEKGSENNYWVQVYSLAREEYISESMAMESITEIAWVSQQSFVFQSRMLQELVVHSWSEGQGEIIRKDLELIYEGHAQSSVVHSSVGLMILDSQGKSIRLSLNHTYSRLIGENRNGFVFLSADKEGFAVLEVLSKVAKKARVIARLDKRVMGDATLDKSGKYIILDHFFGADHKIEIMDLSGISLGEFALPMGVTGKFVGWKKRGQIALLELSSEIREDVIVNWDLSENVNIKNVAKDLLFDGTDQFKTEVIDVASTDGTMIPVRLTYKSGMTLDGKNPALIKVYGGFGIGGTIYGEGFSPMNKLFLQKGGIIVAPAIRGGNEFGDAWYHAAYGVDNKVKVLEDTIAVAEWLKKSRYSSSSRIIATGTSHGGFVVAASALKSQKSFGLVIPIAGVHDMLGKRRTDKVFEEASWADEFGDVRKPKEAQGLRSFSPIEMLADRMKTEFFVLVGQDDNRVNPSHTYKLVEALRAQNVKVQMTSLKNSGHSVELPERHNVVGWRAQTVVWAKIFDFLNISI